MERHDYELKQREDQIIHLLHEYKGKSYGACCTYEVEGRGICEIEIYEINSLHDLPQHIFAVSYTHLTLPTIYSV